MGQVVRHKNTMTSYLSKCWTPEHDETTGTMRARALRKNHSTIVAERDRIDHVQHRAETEDLAPERWAELAHDAV